MRQSLNRVSVFSVALLAGVLLGASSQRATAQESAVAELAPQAVSEMRPPHDPKKKNAGDVCKSADECQAHHTCEKVGDQQVCKAPPPRRLPPGAVT